MATVSLIPVSEYLATVYRPDCDYIEGEIQERNRGELGHGLLQSIFVIMLNANRRVWQIVAVTETRVQVRPDRFRIPDVAVLRSSGPFEPILRTPPLICIEILSPEDRMHRMQERINDYAAMGVAHIWLIDPLSRDAWIASPEGMHKPANGILTVPGTPIRIALAEVFAEFDDMQIVRP